MELEFRPPTDAPAVTVLIVEDSPTQLEGLRFLLDEAGYAVIAATDGRDGLAAAQAHPVDLVISDIVMPGMDGYALCKALRADKSSRHLPVILLTSLNDPQDVIRGLEAGANNFICKPYDDRALLARVRSVLTNQELRRSSVSEMGINIFFAGQRFFITADRLQILDLLLSTYENAVHQNTEVTRMRDELRTANERLEARVAERTAALTAEIEERKRAEAESNRFEEQFHQAQKMESVGRLAGGVAHDFNNMLGVIIGQTEMVLDEAELPDALRPPLNEVLKAAERSADLTRQLLAFARKQVVSPVVLDLNESVGGMSKLVRRLIGENIELVWMPGREPGRVRIDPSQVDQIIANLSVNARDAIGGTGTLTIRLENVTLDDADCLRSPGAKPGEYVRLSVSDTGCGMDKELLKHIFEPFFTTKALGQGTGLGLATVYGIVKQNEGFVDVQSVPGAGSTFQIHLPRQTEAVTAAVAPSDDAPGRGTETVLLVEDEPSILDLGMTILLRYGYKVLTARTPGEALDRVRRDAGPIRLLITDVVLPEMNGRELRDRIQQTRPEIKTLFISGYPADAITHQGVLEAGFDFIQKPFPVKTLARKVREILDRA